MSLPRYAEYKDSGVAWLGEVPAHWDVRPLKFEAKLLTSNVDKKSYEDEVPVLLCNYTDVYYNDRIVREMDFMPATASSSQIERFTLRAGDTIITKDSETADDIAVSAYVPSDMSGVVCGYHLAVIRPGSVSSGPYNKYLFDCHFLQAYFEVSVNGLTRVGLSQGALGGAVIPCPTEDERVVIAAFLDRETGKIDALIAEQEKLLTLLAEKRQATISHAVTRGLTNLPGADLNAAFGRGPKGEGKDSPSNPNVPMKDSGVPWLGEVPSHWRIVRLKFIASVQTGIAKGKDVTGKHTVAVPYLRVANVQDGFLKLDDIAIIEVEPEQVERYRLRPGDVLMNEGGDFDKLGRGAIWHGQIEDCIHQNHVFAVRPQNVRPAWLNQVTSSEYAQFYFMGRSKQSTNLASISSTNIMELPVVLPPDEEQAEILGWIDAETERFNRLESDVSQALILLKERRSALIAAAVTGKIDVRQAA